MNNSFGDLFRLTTFGESHGAAIGGVIDGMPSGITIDTQALREAMCRRRPGSSALVSQRCEPDEVEIISGVFQSVTTGTPLGFIIRNKDQQSRDYDALRHIYRPSHADMTYAMKYGRDLRDYRGGGRASGRETAVRVAGGELARQALVKIFPDLSVTAFTLALGSIKADFPKYVPSRDEIESSLVRAPFRDESELMVAAVEEARRCGDTLGGVVGCIVTGVPTGLGEPVFGKFQATLAQAMLSIGAAKGFDYGSGFEGASKRGSEIADLFDNEHSKNGYPRLLTNNSGGIQGGITNGESIYFRVAFKPIATMMRPTEMYDAEKGSVVEITPAGRHDVTVVPRAVPVIEAMTWLTLMDAVVKHRALSLWR